MRIEATTVIRVVGLIAGAGLAMAFVLAGRVEPSRVAPTATLKLTAGSTGELVTQPTPDLLVARDLRPGAQRRARVSLWNPTDVTLSVRARAVPAAADLDRLVRLEIAAGGRPLFSGPLGALREPTQRTLVLRPGARRTLQLGAAIPHGAGRGYESREVEAKLELTTEIART